MTLSKNGLRYTIVSQGYVGAGCRDVRSDDILGRDRVDGVEPERAEHVPCAHLAAVLILRNAKFVDSQQGRRQGSKTTYARETVDGVVVVVLRDLADARLRLRRCARKRVEVWDVVRWLWALVSQPYKGQLRKKAQLASLVWSLCPTRILLSNCSAFEPSFGLTSVEVLIQKLHKLPRPRR